VFLFLVIKLIIQYSVGWAKEERRAHPTKNLNLTKLTGIKSGAIYVEKFNDFHWPRAYLARKYSEPPSLYSQAASQVAPSPAGEGWGEENKIKTFLISPHPTFSRWRRLSPRDKVRVSEYLQ